MSSYVSLDQLAVLVKTKRGKKGLRETAAEIGGVSPSTLSRIEQGKMPDLDTFLRLCEWLGVSPNQFVRSNTDLDANDQSLDVTIPPGMSTPDAVAVHLRADKELDPDTAEALAEMVRAAYKAIVDGKIGKRKGG